MLRTWCARQGLPSRMWSDHTFAKKVSCGGGIQRGSRAAIRLQLPLLPGGLALRCGRPTVLMGHAMFVHPPAASATRCKDASLEGLNPPCRGRRTRRQTGCCWRGQRGSCGSGQARARSSKQGPEMPTAALSSPQTDRSCVPHHHLRRPSSSVARSGFVHSAACGDATRVGQPPAHRAPPGHGAAAARQDSETRPANAQRRHVILSKARSH